MTSPPKCGADGRDAAIGAPGETSIGCSLRIRPVHRFGLNATRVKVSAEMNPLLSQLYQGQRYWRPQPLRRRLNRSNRSSAPRCFIRGRPSSCLGVRASRGDDGGVCRIDLQDQAAATMVANNMLFRVTGGLRRCSHGAARSPCVEQPSRLRVRNPRRRE
jgi:hypothetical protein